MSLEQVVAADPAFIILGDARYEVSPEINRAATRLGKPERRKEWTGCTVQ